LTGKSRKAAVSSPDGEQQKGSIIKGVPERDELISLAGGSHFQEKKAKSVSPATPFNEINPGKKRNPRVKRHRRKPPRALSPECRGNHGKSSWFYRPFG